MEKRRVMERIFYNKGERLTKNFLEKKKKDCERDKLLLRISEKRKNNFERLNRIEKLIKIKNQILNLRSREDKVVIEDIQNHRNNSLRRLKKRGSRNRRKIKKKLKIEKEVQELRFEKLNQLFKITSLNPHFKNIEALDFFKTEKIDSPLIFEFDKEDFAKASENETKDVYFKAKNEIAISEGFEMGYAQLDPVLKNGIMMVYFMMKGILNFYSIPTPIVFEDFSLFFLMKK